MYKRYTFLYLFLTTFLCSNAMPENGYTIDGVMQKWHPVTITFTGPSTSESADPNPFLDYRHDVTFTTGKKKIIVPGYFATDGNAAETGAESGDKWRVHFMPDETGEWTFEASFKTGKEIAVLDPPDAKAGKPIAFHGAKGKFTVQASDKTGRDHRAKGLLRYTGERYLRFAETNEPYIKGGADSPENFLAYADFDGTYFGGEGRKKQNGEADHNAKLHRYQSHVKDWNADDPTWKNGKGKGIIGALNYLSGKGMNSVYFLTMNVIGDGKDVWPWTGYDERYRFDCSKLDQWEIVFQHTDKVGLLLHVITQETENDQLLDGGDLGIQRKLYYRELIARFAHHPALVWNLGEENTNSDLQRMAFSQYIQQTDPYDHPVVVHTYPNQYDRVYTPLLGFPHLQGPSLQMGDQKKTHSETIEWIDRSGEAGHRWFVCLDEIGPADTGVKPDTDDPGHDDVRRYSLWGNLMAGGAGCEWYFGYQFAHNDLNCEDWRSREIVWDQTRYALEFFHAHLPFTEMVHHDELTADEDAYCLAKPGEVYAVYDPAGGDIELELADGTYSIQWYDPRNGGSLRKGSVPTIEGPGVKSLGNPPSDAGKDWVVLVKK